MRSRRNAAASSSDDSSSEPLSDSPATNPAENAAEPNPSLSAEIPSDSDAAPDAAAAGETAKPRRRAPARRRTATPAAETPDAPAIALAEGADVVAASPAPITTSDDSNASKQTGVLFGDTPAETPNAPDAAEAAPPAPRSRRRTPSPRRRVGEEPVAAAEEPVAELSAVAAANSANSIESVPETVSPVIENTETVETFDAPMMAESESVDDELPLLAETSANEEMLGDTAAAAETAEAIEVLDTDESAAVPEAGTPTRGGRRRNRGRGGRGAEVIPAPEVIELVGESSSAVVPPPAPPTPTGGNGGNGGNSGNNGGGGGGRQPRTRGRNNNSAPAAPAPAGTTSPDAKGRTRGLRTRRLVVAAPLTIASPVIENSATAPDAVAKGQTAATPRRVRGLRRPAPASLIAAVPEAAPNALLTTGGGTAATSEPLPPVYTPLPAETLARLPETKIVVRNGISELVVNGEPRLPLWFFVNTEDTSEEEMDDAAMEAARETARRQIRYAYEAGVRTITVLAHLPWKMRSGERRYGPLDEILQFVADNAPEAMVLPRLIFSPPQSWERNHPDQMSVYADGEPGDVSIASRSFWEGEAEEALRAAVEHVAEGPHAGRVWGFYLEHGEWLYEKGRGYDLSPASEQGFRSWLKTRYKNNQVALRAAWNDGEAAFDTVAIPAQPAPDGTTAFFTPREQRYADFHEYASDAVAQVILRLGRAVKEASGNRSAVAVSYGYTLELARAFSGHLSLGQILASPFVDILTGPVSYSGRTPGGSAPFPAPIESVTLAGKLWVSEDDTKTFLADSANTPDAYNPKVSSPEGTWAAYARNFGAALASGTGVSWMDLWGRGWLDDRDLWQRLGRLRAFADEIAALRRARPEGETNSPDVAVIVDERSFFAVRSHANGRDGADEALLGNLIAHQRDALLRSGARIGFYLLSDLTKPEFPTGPTGPKLLLFLNAFQIPDAVRTAIQERFQGDGRTLAWVYAPGSRETSLAELTDTFGIQLRLQPWGAKMGTQVLSQVRSPLTENIKGQRIGEETRVNPSYYVSDARAQVLGEYAATGNASLAVRKHARWQSVFIGEMSLSLPLLRGLYRLAGVPIYTVDDDVAWFGDGFICLHSAPGGGTTVFLPGSEGGAIYDVLADETLAANGHGARLSMPPRGTRLLFYGTPEAVTRLGGDPGNAPHGLTESELPPPPAPFAFDPGSAAPPAKPSFAAETTVPASAEDAALMEAAMAGEFPLTENGEAAAPVEGGAAGDAESRKKRRRRRRRKGDEAVVGEGDLLLDEAESADEEGDIAPSAEIDSETDPNGLTNGIAEITETDAAETLTPETEEPSLFAPEAVVVPVASAATAGPRTRPSLAELLPQSEFALDAADLPPIPDEFLPLDAGAFASAGSETPTDDTPSSARPAGRRPRRRVGTARRSEEPSSDVTETAGE